VDVEAHRQPANGKAGLPDSTTPNAAPALAHQPALAPAVLLWHLRAN